MAEAFGNLGNVAPITFQGTGNGLIEGYYNNISGVAVVYYSSRTETSAPITYSMNVKSKLKTLGALNKEGTYLGVDTNSNIITVNCDKPYAVGQICFICEPVS